jgi:hypothetical protein
MKRAHKGFGVASTCGRLQLIVLILLAVWVSAAAGCAQERDPINRVQANAISKHFFLGPSLSDSSDDPEFYWRNYVVDASVNQSPVVGIGSWSGVDRIRWEVTETHLLARKAYQIVEGADNKGVPGKDPNGAVVASYAILSHFDIKRDYNLARCSAVLP